MNKYIQYGLSTIFAFLLFLVIDDTIYRLSRVGKGRSSHTIGESKERGVFIGYYKMLENKHIDDFNNSSIIWVEQYYKITSWDFSEIEVGQHTFTLHIDSVPQLSMNLRNQTVSLLIDGVVSLQPSRKGNIGMPISSRRLSDTLKLYVYKGDKSLDGSILAVDSFRLYRVK